MIFPPFFRPGGLPGPLRGKTARNSGPDEAISKFPGDIVEAAWYHDAPVHGRLQRLKNRSSSRQLSAPKSFFRVKFLTFYLARQK